MISKNSLFLHEEIMLLSIRDKDGTIFNSDICRHAIGGAVLAELLLEERITVKESKKKLVDLVSQKKLGDPIIDECLQRIRDAKRRSSIKTWVTRFAGLKNLNHRVADQLCKRGIMRVEKNNVMRVFKRNSYLKIDPQPERKLIDRLRKAIFTETTDIDPRTSVIVSLANSAGLLKEAFDKKELKGRKNRIKKIQNGELTGKATKEAIEAAQFASLVPFMITLWS